MNGITLLEGDCRETLKTLPDNSVHCVVTSPPYWGLRDYGTAAWEGGDPECDHRQTEVRQRRNLAEAANASDGGSRTSEGRTDKDALWLPYRDICGKCGAKRFDRQMGLEETPDEFVAGMVAVFREVRRVLRSDGTCWVNMGDSYNANQGSGFNAHEKTRPHLSGDGVSQKRLDDASRNTVRKQPKGLKPKDIVGIPWMLAFALRADGWWLRQDIIWHKPSPMPESVTDRCTKSHEYIFLLTKSSRYYFDNEAIKEPVTGNAHSRGHAMNPKCEANAKGNRQNESFSGAINGFVETRNKRSVWTVASQSYSGAHFATFPPALIRPCILAGTSEHGCCPDCGAPWERIVESNRVATRPGNDTKVGRASDDPDSPYEQHSGMIVGNRDPQRHTTVTKTTGWQPTCECGRPDSDNVPCTVLDPFNGSGTTGEVARDAGCLYIGCELNPEYLALSRKRLQQGSLLV